MIGLVEDACLAAIQPFLDDGDTTVGTRVDISHVAPAREGELVTIMVQLTKIMQNRLLTFDVAVTSPSGVIGRGLHQRLVVNRSAFRPS
jgi:predicted thioesterase